MSVGSRPAAALKARLRELIEAGHGPLFVGIDGRSGAGKSTVAAAVREDLSEPGDGIDVTVIDGDSFYAGGSAERWDRRTSAEKADQVISWRRQRAVLEQLRGSGVAEWHPFDWEADDWDREPAPLAATPIVARSSLVVLLDGAYSCRPELHGSLDLRVLVVVPRDVRRRRLLEREGAEYRADWEDRWAAAEDHYFGSVMPPDRFDLVLDDQ